MPPFNHVPTELSRQDVHHLGAVRAMHASLKQQLLQLSRKIPALSTEILKELSTDDLHPDVEEWVQDELAKREDEEPHPDTPSLQDRGLELPDYGS